MAEGSAAFLRKVIDSVGEANHHGLLCNKGSEMLGGLSGRKTVGALQRLTRLFVDDPGACYVEIGVFQGLTLLSVAVNFPGFPCFGIDDFSLLDPEGKNLGIVRERIEKLGAGNAHLINMDFETALEGLDDHLGGRRIGVYFIDGAHDYRSQVLALMLALPYLHENAVILIDDTNYAFVRQSTRDFLVTHPEFKMVFDAYSPAHPANMDAKTRERHVGGWLNGVNILVRDPHGIFPAMYPPTERSRTLYVNEWLVHRHPFAELAPEAVRLARAACSGDSAEEDMRKADLLERFEEMRDVIAKRYPDRNTYSDVLPEARFNTLPS